MSRETNSFRKFLEGFQVKDLMPKDFKLIRVETTTTILDALRVLRKEKILSIPVYDPEERKYVGLVDMLDVLSLFVTLSELKSIIDIFSKKPLDDEETWMKFFEKEKELVQEEHVDQIINASQRNPWCPVFHGLPLLSLIDMFSKDVNLHRVPVIDGNGEVVGLISQSRIIEFISKNAEKFSDIAQQNLKTLVSPLEWAAPASIKTVKEDETTLAAFEKIIDEKVTGLAVVNEKGELVGSLSATDLKRSIDSNLFSDLYLPVSRYLEKGNPEFPHTIRKEPITVTHDESIKSILNKISSNSLHRIFAVENKKPVRIVSLCDLLTVLNQM